MALRNIYYHPLSRYPGPRLWAAFRLPYCFSLWRGTLVRHVHAIHQEYGDIVRVAPNEISVARSDGWNDIYCRRSGHQPFPKNPIWWSELPGRTPSVLSTPHPADHRRMRGLLSTCFTPSALQAQEPAIISHIDNLIYQLRKHCLSKENDATTIDIVEWSSFTFFDIIGDLGFGESFGCLDNNSLHPWVAELFSYSKVGALVAALRHYTFIFEKLMRCLPARTLEAAQANYQWGVEKTHRRLGLDVQREDFIKRILHHSDKGNLRMSTPELENNMNVLIVAGSETTATAVSGTINYLLRTPSALRNLVSELRSTYQRSCDMTFSNLREIPYLVAVVEEGLRLCPPVPCGTHHIVPAGGDTVCGGWLPGGTHVSVHHQSLYRSPANFHDPDNFHPERWLIEAQTNSASPFHRDRRDAVHTFGIGSWSCIGQTLAYAELYTFAAKLFWHFDVSKPLDGRDVDWVMQKSYAMMDKQPFDIQIACVRS